MPTDDSLKSSLMDDTNCTHELFDRNVLPARLLEDTPVVVVWNGRNTFAVTKPLVSEEVDRLNRLNVYRQGIYMQYMLGRMSMSTMSPREVMYHARGSNIHEMSACVVDND